MKKFDLKKFITENKATFHSSLNEGYDEFKRAEKGSKDVTAKDKGEEEVYGAGVKKGEEIEKKKMKVSELKAKIKEMVLSEMTLDVDNMEDAPESEVDFLAELEGMLEQDEKSAEEEAAAEDVTVDDTETTDVETTAEVNPNVKAVQDSLTQAQAAAQKLGDKKLIDQIGNTITFFTRTHVVEKPGTVAEMYIAVNKNTQDAIDKNDLEKAKEIHSKAKEFIKDMEGQGRLDPSVELSIDSYYEDIKALEKKFPELKGTVTESMFPLLKKILK